MGLHSLSPPSECPIQLKCLWPPFFKTSSSMGPPPMGSCSRTQQMAKSPQPQSTSPGLYPERTHRLTPCLLRALVGSLSHQHPLENLPLCFLLTSGLFKWLQVHLEWFSYSQACPECGSRYPVVSSAPRTDTLVTPPPDLLLTMQLEKPMPPKRGHT